MYDVISIKSDLICVRDITWEQTDSRSAIDLILANARIHERIKSMLIDKSWSSLKISDQNVIAIEIKIRIFNMIRSKGYSRSMKV